MDPVTLAASRLAQLTDKSFNGGWYIPQVASTASTNAGTLFAGMAYGCVLWLMQPMAFDRIAIRIATEGGTGALVRLGVYRLLKDGTAELVLDAGQVDVSSTGLKSIMFGSQLELPPGAYWLVGVIQGDEEAARPVWLYASGNNILGCVTEFFGPAATFVSLETGIDGALPETLTPTSDSRTARPPIVGLRVI